LLDNDQGQDSNIGANNAATDGLAATFTGAADAVARVPFCQEKSDPVWEENTLLHWETLLIVSASNTEDVAFPFVAQRISRNFLGNFLVIKYTTEAISVNNRD
jgi:hypothetical protein